MRGQFGCEVEGGGPGGRCLLVAVIIGFFGVKSGGNEEFRGFLPFPEASRKGVNFPFSNVFLGSYGYLCSRQSMVVDWVRWAWR